MEHSDEMLYGLPVVQGYNSIWNNPTTIFQYKTEVQQVCPKCKKNVKKQKAYIPIGDNKHVELLGKYCFNCKSFFVNPNVKIAEVLKDNKYAKTYTYNNRVLWDYTEKRIQKKRIADLKRLEQENRIKDRERMEKVKSSVMLIAIENALSEEFEYIIVNDPKVSDESSYIVHYAEDIGKELLSAAFASERDKNGSWRNIKYSVTRCNLANNHLNTINLIPTSIVIRSGGGYYNFDSKGSYKIVDLLLYSPFNNRYECIKATYDSNESYCYSDPGLFREFVYHYGNPGIPIDFATSRHGKLDWKSLNEESILRIYGYSVSKQHDISTNVRWRLLEELVDLGVLSVVEIVKQLKFNISTHSQPSNAEARAKWALDIEHIKTYKANPERFLIAKIKNQKI